MDKTEQGTPASKLDYLMNDAMVALFIMNKHIKRGQKARALNDNNHLMGLGAEFIMACDQKNTFHTSLYAFDKVMQETKAGPDAVLSRSAQKLEDLVFAPPSAHKIISLFDAMKTIHAHGCDGKSEIYSHIRNFEECIIEPLRKQEAPALKVQKLVR